MAAVQSAAPKHACKILVGNKSDLGKIKVPQQAISTLAGSSKMEYLEVSAKQAFNVSEIFRLAEKHVASRLEAGELKVDSEVQ